jgi:hypothetical protein
MPEYSMELSPVLWRIESVATSTFYDTITMIPLKLITSR